MFFPKAETNHREKKVYLSWGWRCKCMGTHTHIILFVLYLAHQEWLSQLDERVHTYSFFSFLSLSLLLLVFSPFFFTSQDDLFLQSHFQIVSHLLLITFGCIWFPASHLGFHIPSHSLSLSLCLSLSLLSFSLSFSPSVLSFSPPSNCEKGWRRG